MTQDGHLLGIDVGTSSAKAVLIAFDGRILASSAPQYAFRTPRPLWAESDPEDWWQATLTAIRNVLATSKVNPTSIRGIGLTGQMHGLVLLDAAGEVLRPCIMWNDQRTGEECREITKAVGRDQVLSLIANPVLPGFTGPKVRWVRKHEPGIYERIAHILLPKDYVRFRLSDAFATDVADASGTAFLNVRLRRWQDEMMEASGAKPAWLPELFESCEESARLTSKAAAETGLTAGIPIAAGAGDQAAQAIGSGIVEEGRVSTTFGTSGVVFAHSGEFRMEPEGRLHAFCAAVPGEWHMMGVMLSAAGSFQWFRNNLGGEEMAAEQRGEGDAYDLLVAAAEKVPPGSGGLVFLPYLTGERTPYPDPLARGAFVGLTLRHSKAHLVRAVLEGVTFGMRDSLELMRSAGIRPREIVASGGGAKSSFWCQLMADVFDTPIEMLDVGEGAAFGAALLAGVCTGVYADVPSACRATLRVTGKTAPDTGSVECLEKFYSRYRALYPALKDEFAALAALDT